MEREGRKPKIKESSKGRSAFKGCAVYSVHPQGFLIYTGTQKIQRFYVNVPSRGGNQSVDCRTSHDDDLFFLFSFM